MPSCTPLCRRDFSGCATIRKYHSIGKRLNNKINRKRNKHTVRHTTRYNKREVINLRVNSSNRWSPAGSCLAICRVLHLALSLEESSWKENKARLVYKVQAHDTDKRVVSNRELKQRRWQRHRQRKHHLKIYLYFICATSRDYFNSLNFYKNGELSKNQIGRSGVQVNKENENSTVMRSRSPRNLKCGHFTLLFSRGRQRVVPKCKAHVQSDCFCSLNLLFCGVVRRCFSSGYLGTPTQLIK